VSWHPRILVVHPDRDERFHRPCSCHWARLQPHAPHDCRRCVSLHPSAQYLATLCISFLVRIWTSMCVRAPSQAARAVQAPLTAIRELPCLQKQPAKLTARCAGNHEYTFKRNGGDHSVDPSGSTGYDPDWANFGNGAPLHPFSCASRQLSTRLQHSNDQRLPVCALFHRVGA